MSYCLSIIKLSPRRFCLGAIVGTFSLVFFSCSSTNRESDNAMYGTIAYPFVKGKPLGINSDKERFIVRSRVGDTEYVVEIPHAAEDYDIEVPLSALESQARGGGGDRPSGLGSPVATDKELMESLPDITKKDPTKSAFIDKAFGMGKSMGPVESPSLILGLSKISNYYKRKEYEAALIEINNLIPDYPNIPRLYKMKGSILIKIQDFALAEKAWQKALDLDPRDATVRMGLINLQKKKEKRFQDAPAEDKGQEE